MLYIISIIEICILMERFRYMKEEGNSFFILELTLKQVLNIISITFHDRLIKRPLNVNLTHFSFSSNGLLLG